MVPIVHTKNHRERILVALYQTVSCTLEYRENAGVSKESATTTSVVMSRTVFCPSIFCQILDLTKD